MGGCLGFNVYFGFWVRRGSGRIFFDRVPDIAFGFALCSNQQAWLHGAVEPRLTSDLGLAFVV